MIKDVVTLKDYFNTGDRPTQNELINLISSRFVAEDATLALNSLSQIPTDETFYLVGSSVVGAITLTKDPQVLAGKSNQVIFLTGVSASDYIILEDGRGLALRDSIHLKTGVYIILCYQESINLWLEVARTEENKISTDVADPVEGFLNTKLQHTIEYDSVTKKIQIKGDSGTPNVSSFYGTNPSGDFGFNTLLTTTAINLREADNAPNLTNVDMVSFNQDVGLRIASYPGNAALVYYKKYDYGLITGLHIASKNEYLFIDTMLGSFNLVLPLNPNLGDCIMVNDIGGYFEDNPLTLDRNGEKINGAVSNLDLLLNNSEYKLIFTGFSFGWKVVFLGVRPIDLIDDNVVIKEVLKLA